MNVFDLAARVPWLIQPDVLQTILEIAARENPTPEAVAAQLGRPLDNTHTVTYRGGVAIIPVEGPLFRKANLFTQVSGATSTEILAQDLHAALTDTTVQAILLAIDSPGGEANGISEFANMVYDARVQKPITAYISGLGASAAYWIASAASDVVVDHAALVGNIGVVMAVRDPTKTAARDIEFVSSQSPHKRPNPTTEKGRAQLQGIVDGLADVFVAAVARNRSVSEQTVLNDFGGGALFVGEAAVMAGLADRVGSFEQTLTAMGAHERARGVVGLPGSRAQAGGDEEAARMAEADDDREPTAAAPEDADKKAQAARSRRHGIGIKDGGNVTRPAEFKNVPDGAWGDPVNYRYPCHDKGHADNAASRWGDPANRAQYSSKEQGIISGRITARQAHFGSDKKAAWETSSAEADVPEDQEDGRMAAETAMQLTQDQARFAEMERQLAEHKAQAEQARADATAQAAATAAAQAEAQRATADAQEAAARITAMEQAAQRRAYADVARDWPGAPTEEYVGFMMSEVKTGAGLEWFTKLQRAHAAQVQAAGLWSEKGRAGQDTTDDPQERLGQLVKTTMAEHRISYREAASRVAAEHPEMVAAATAASQVKV